MLATAVSLHDIRDVEAFVGSTLGRAGIRPDDPIEREDLIADGILIVSELAERYEPHRDGYARAGSFAGYCAKFLPGRMRDAWHSRHPEHSYVTRDDGRREWSYGESAISLDGLREQNPDGVELRIGARVSESDTSFADLAAAIAQASRRRDEIALVVAQMKAAGYSHDAIAEELELGPSEFRFAIEQIRDALSGMCSWG